LLKVYFQKNLKSWNYYCNLLLKDEFGKTFEIDFLLVTDYWIYVFEIKNWNNYLIQFNTITEHNVLVYSDYGKKYERYSPIYQNDQHIVKLSKLLFVKKWKFINVVVFNENMKVNWLQYMDWKSFENNLWLVKNKYYVIKRLLNTVENKTKYKINRFEIIKKINNLKILWNSENKQKHNFYIKENFQK
jgi:hypothetical protein